MRHSLDFITFELKRSTQNLFLWIAQLFVFYTIYNEASRYIGKKGYLLSELIQSGTLTVSQEMIARAVIFSVNNMLLVGIFIFASYFSIFLDNRYKEITLSKPLKTSRLVGYKLTASYLAVILTNFVAAFIFTWICLHNYQLPFEPLYFSVLYLLYSLIPLLFWLFLSFTLAVLVSDVKIFYPLMLLLWFANLFPGKYSLSYLHWMEINLANPLGDAGLLINRAAYLALAIIVLKVGIKLLEAKRKDLFHSNISWAVKAGKESHVYRYRNSRLAGLLASFKVNLSWKFVWGLIMFAVLPPLLNSHLPHLFNGMLSTSEIVIRILRSGEIFISLSVLLYASYFLFSENLYHTSEIIACRPKGFSIANHTKLQLLFFFTTGMLLVFYGSIYIFVDHLSLAAYLTIILPEIMLYLLLPFAAVSFCRHKKIALASCYLLWTFNLIGGLKLPIFINTFAPIYLINSVGYKINRIELIVITVVLWAVYNKFSRRKASGVWFS